MKKKRTNVGFPDEIFEKPHGFNCTIVLNYNYIIILKNIFHNKLYIKISLIIVVKVLFI